MWHFVHVVGPDFWPAFLFSLWHLVHNLFITYFFFSVPAAFSSAMLPDFCGNTEWHILQSPSRSWCWRWGNGTLPFLPAFILMSAAPLFWSAIVKATEKPAIRAATSKDTTRSFIFKMHAILLDRIQPPSVWVGVWIPITSIASNPIGVIFRSAAIKGS